MPEVRRASDDAGEPDPLEGLIPKEWPVKLLKKTGDVTSKGDGVLRGGDLGGGDVMETTEIRATRRPLDAYFTPEPLALACMSWLARDGFYRGGSVLEPSSGQGAFIKAARRHTADVYAVDIDPQHEKAAMDAGAKAFLCADFERALLSMRVFDLVIGNPPFSGALPHTEHALLLRSSFGAVAFLLRLAFLESKDRASFWRSNPASKVYVFSERPSFTGGGTDSAAYGLFVWQRGWTRPTELEVASWR